MSEQNPTPDRDFRLDGWTARAFAEALDLGEEQAERLLDGCVGDGLAVRLSWRDLTIYVPGDLAEALTRADVAPVEGDRLAGRQAMVRQLAARERARRVLARDDKEQGR